MISTICGTDNFYELVTEGNLLVDKTLFIKEVIESNYKFLLITRPRRWGKSINFDMFKRFLNIEVDKEGNKLKINSNRILFEGGEIQIEDAQSNVDYKKICELKISKIDQGKFMRLQGKTPVILLSLKECLGNDKEKAIESIKLHIKNLYRKYSFLAKSKELNPIIKDQFVEHLKGEFTIEELKESLAFLTELLYQHFNIKVWVLIDEHDKPGSHFLTLPNYMELIEDRKEITGFITSMIARCGKGNEFVKKTILTGVTDFIIREGASGFNNISEIYDLNNMNFSDHYGLSQNEVEELIDKTGYKGEDKKKLLNQLKEWYDGYNSLDRFNNKVCKYNIWSVINHIIRVQNQGIDVTPLSYWSNSIMNDILENISNLGASDYIISLLHDLSKGEEVKLPIPNKDFSIIGNIDNIYARNMLISYLLLNYGYLNIKDERLTIPNKEVLKYFRDIILQVWLNISLDYFKSNKDYNIHNLGHDLCKNLLNKDMFLKVLRDKLINKIKGCDKSENYFKSLVGGVIELYNLYNFDMSGYYTAIEKVVGNRGRIDNIFYPKSDEEDIKKPVIIHEYKKSSKNDVKNLDLLDLAIWQVFEKNYIKEPLTKLKLHKEYYEFDYIRVRGVLFLGDENTQKWSVMIKENDLSIAAASKMVEFMNNPNIIKLLELVNINRNIEKIKRLFYEKLKVKDIESFISIFENLTKIESILEDFYSNI